jgi:DNA-binding response OmpR family regulator
VITFRRVLVVQDDALDLQPIYDALRKAFVVRVANAGDAPVVAKAVPIACIIGVLDGEVGARSLHDALAAARDDAQPKFLFLRSDEATDDDAVFLLTSGHSWLPLTTAPDELVATVRRLCG